MFATAPTRSASSARRMAARRASSALRRAMAAARAARAASRLLSFRPLGAFAALDERPFFELFEPFLELAAFLDWGDFLEECPWARADVVNAGARPRASAARRLEASRRRITMDRKPSLLLISGTVPVAL